MSDKIDIKSITKQVQHNCDISDAYYAVPQLSARKVGQHLEGKLLHLYREEAGLKPWEIKVNGKKFYDWLEKKHSKWKSKYQPSKNKDELYSNIEIGGHSFHYFDPDAISEKLVPAGYVYFAGAGREGKDSFYLAKIAEHWTENGFNSFIPQKELAKDLDRLGVPASKPGKNICGRPEEAKQMIWNRINSIKNHLIPEHQEEILIQALHDYGLSEDEFKRKPGEIAKKVDKIAMTHLKYIMSHELGHGLAEEKEILPDELKDMVWELAPGTDLEWVTWALSDVLANTIKVNNLNGMLAHIIKNKDVGELGLFAYNIMPPNLHPIGRYQSQIWSSYQSYWTDLFWTFHATGDWGLIERARKKTYKKATKIANGLKELDKEEGLNLENLREFYSEALSS
ncbi:MAG: Sfum_1244 family protein [Candidatus Aenigmatarchaeota archaeon]